MTDDLEPLRAVLRLYGIAPEIVDYATAEELAELEKALQILSQTSGAWTLQPRQQVAESALTGLESGALYELLYGGAAGGGKSEWLLYHCLRVARTYPGARCLMLRRTFPELRRSLIMRSLEKIKPQAGDRFMVADKEWKFANGSVIEFGYCESETDVYQYQSAEYAVIAFDELTQWPHDSTSDDPEPDQSFVYTYLISRLRVPMSLAKLGLVPHIIAGTNPGGIGGSWVRKRFIDLGPAETWHEVRLPNGRLSKRMFVPARISDNRYIDRPTYEAALSSLNEKTRAALMDGDWDTVEGQFFTEWSRDVHVAPVTVERHWTRLGGYDYGYTAPACFLLGAFDGDGNAYIYREWYDTKHTPPQQAKKIKGLLARTKVDAIYCDPSIWNQTGAGPPIAQQLIDGGLAGLRRASNKRIDGWVRMREFLRVDKNLGRSRLIVDPSCVHLIRTLPMLVHDRKNPEDLDTRGEDHAVDALRYLLMSRPHRRSAPRQAPTDPEERLAWEIAQNHKKKRRTDDRQFAGM